MNKSIAVIICFLCHIHLYSQEIKVTNDIGSWIGFEIQKKLNKKTTLSLDQQLRLFENSTKLDDYLIQIGAKHKLNKNFKIGANLRYTLNAKRRKKTENNYRYNLDLLYKGKITNEFSIHYRLRYQQEFINSFLDYNVPNSYKTGTRNRIKAEYRINKSNLIYTSGEVFRTIEVFKKPHFNQVRIHIGYQLKTKPGVLDFSLGCAQEINANYPLTFFFLRAKYKLKL